MVYGAEIAGEYRSKGSNVYVEGSLKTEKLEDRNGNKKQVEPHGQRQRPLNNAIVGRHPPYNAGTGLPNDSLSGFCCRGNEGNRLKVDHVGPTSPFHPRNAAAIPKDPTWPSFLTISAQVSLSNSLADG